MLRFVLAVSISLVAYAQADAQQPAAAPPHAEAQQPAAVPEHADATPATTQAQEAFDDLKALAGSWQGHLATVPSVPEVEGKSARVVLRVASRGHTLMHDLTVEGLPDNPLTMLVVDADRLLLTHYCDADNRPRMIGKMSPDGKTVDFDFLDISGNLAHGHMQHAEFTLIDENHHVEDWTFMMPGDKPIRAHFDLWRTPAGKAVAAR